MAGQGNDPATMTNPPALSIVVPVYNEARAVRKTGRAIREVLGRLATGSEAIFVDDGSTDGSAEVLAELAAAEPDRFRVLRHRRNRGYGAALKTGIRTARNELVGICDADGTYPVDKLFDLAQSAEDEGAEMVIGARPPWEQPYARRPAKWVLRRLAEHLTGERIPDMNSGLRVFRRAEAMRLWGLLPDGFSFTTTITMALLTEGAGVKFLPVTYRRRVGSSKIRPLRDTGGFLLLICRTALAFNPLRVFGPAGGLLLGLGVLMLLARVVAPEPFGLATTILLIVGGLQVLAIGLLADLINRRGSAPERGADFARPQVGFQTTEESRNE